MKSDPKTGQISIDFDNYLRRFCMSFSGPGKELRIFSQVESRRGHLGHITDKGGTGGHLGGIWGASGRHLGVIWEASGDLGFPGAHKDDLKGLRLKNWYTSQLKSSFSSKTIKKHWVLNKMCLKHWFLQHIWKAKIPDVAKSVHRHPYQHRQNPYS